MFNTIADDAWATRLRTKYGIAFPMAPPTDADNDDFEDLAPYMENDNE